jgi:hypothetical protein
MKLKFFSALALLALTVNVSAFAYGPRYGGGSHTASHGGSYSSGSGGSSHKGGTYKSPSGGHTYGKHK